VAEPRNYLANAAGAPPAKPSAPSTGYPQTAVDGVTEATVPGPYWYYQIGAELRNAILEGGLTPADATLDQIAAVLGKVFGRTNNGDPNGVLAADRLHERCWDTSQSPPQLYIATAADGTTSGTTWTLLREALAYPQTTQVFTASGNWSKPAGCRFIELEVYGAGGGGGGSNNADRSGTGGGAGGYARKLIDVTGIPSATVTVGSGGSGGSVSGDGSSGGNSSWDDGTHVVTANGGNGGERWGPSDGAAGGAASGGDVNATGGAGDSPTDTYGGRVGGGGGDSAVGAGGASTVNGQTGYAGDRGGGGSGGAGDTSNAFAGGDGGDGFVSVREFY